MASPERTTSKPHPLINRSEFTLDGGPIPIHVSIDTLDHDALRAVGIDLDAR